MFATILTESHLKRKSTKSVKRSKVITQRPKTFENPNIVDIKPVITEHLKTSHKLFKTMRKAEKVSQVGSGKSSNTPLYSETKLNIF